MRLIIILIVVVLIAGFSFTAYSNYQKGANLDSVKEKMDNLEDQVASLNKTLEKELNEGNEPGVTVGEKVEELVVMEDTRMLVTGENMGEIINKHLKDKETCTEEFIEEFPNEIEKYSNKEKGISFDIPYNKQWGSDEYRINSYDEYDLSISFGNIFNFEGCSWSRTNGVVFEKKRSADEVIKELKEKIKNNEMLTDLEPEKITINDLTVVKYTDEGLCGYPYLEIIGKKHNYLFGLTCGGDYEKEFKELEDLVKTVKLID